MVSQYDWVLVPTMLFADQKLKNKIKLLGYSDLGFMEGLRDATFVLY